MDDDTVDAKLAATLGDMKRQLEDLQAIVAERAAKRTKVSAAHSN